VVDIGAAAREIASPQTSKSASVFAGLGLMDRVSIWMKIMRDGGDVAPVGTGGADDDEAVGGSLIAAGQIVTTNCARSRCEGFEGQIRLCGMGA